MRRRYTHLISVDYFNDIMAVFTQLLAAPGLPLPERLRLLATASAILRGQGEALTVDRRELYVQLYDALLQVGGSGGTRAVRVHVHAPLLLPSARTGTTLLRIPVCTHGVCSALCAGACVRVSAQASSRDGSLCDIACP